jgi:hypothetical protein
MIDLSEFITTSTKYKYYVLYVKEDNISVLDLFMNEKDGNNFIEYLKSNVNFEGELYLFELGEKVYLEQDEPELSIEDKQTQVENEETEIQGEDEEPKETMYKKKKKKKSKLNISRHKKSGIKRRFRRKGNR